MTYRTTVALFLVGCLVASCDLLRPVDPLSQLELEAAAEMTGDTILYTLQISNPTREDVELQTGGCFRGVALLAYEPRAAGGRLVWDVTVMPPGTKCFPILLGVVVPAGGESLLTEMKRSADILGDSLPEGIYGLAVIPYFHENHRLSQRELPVGDWMLTR